MNNHCQCYDGFAGVDCSIVDTALVPGVTQSGSVALRKWRYFHFDLLSAGQEATFRMHETNTGFNHDCDLYVQVNEYPTQRSYYAKDTSWGVNAVVRVNATAPRGTWFVGIFGFLGCTFEMNVTVPQSACPNGCSGNGTCETTLSFFFFFFFFFFFSWYEFTLSFAQVLMERVNVIPALEVLTALLSIALLRWMGQRPLDMFRDAHGITTLLILLRLMNVL